MDPTAENQNEQKKQGGISQGINAFNNLVDFRRGFGKKAAAQAGKTAAQATGKIAAQTAAKAALSNPYVLAALGAVVFVIIVFAIVASGAAPGAPIPETGNQTDSATVPIPPAAP